MPIEIVEIDPGGLKDYARVSIAYSVKSVFRVDPIAAGLGGLALVEVPVEPYVKDYDDMEGTPSDWPAQFDLRGWGLFLAKDGDLAVGGAAVGVVPGHALEDRPGLCVLWDLRTLRPAYTGVGIQLFAAPRTGRGSAATDK